MLAPAPAPAPVWRRVRVTSQMAVRSAAARSTSPTISCE